MTKKKRKALQDRIERDYKMLKARNESDKRSKLKYFRENLSLKALSAVLDEEARKALKAKATRTTTSKTTYPI